MSNGFEQLVTALESRYDFQSARTMAREALSVASLKEEAKYSQDELQKFVDGLAQVGSKLDGVWSLLGVSPTGAPAPAVAPVDEKKVDDKKADAKKADDKKAEEAPAKQAPAKKADDKKADDKKADDKKADDKKADAGDKKPAAKKK